MNKRSGPTLAQRLYTISGALIFGMLALAVTVAVLMKDIVSEAHTVGVDRAPQLQRIAEIELNVTRASLQLRHAILARTPEEMKTALADVVSKKKIIEETLEQFGEAAKHEPQAAKAFANMQVVAKEFWAIGGENINLIASGQKDKAFAFLADTTVAARNRLLAP